MPFKLDPMIFKEAMERFGEADNRGMVDFPKEKFDELVATCIEADKIARKLAGGKYPEAALHYGTVGTGLSMGIHLGLVYAMIMAECKLPEDYAVMFKKAFGVSDGG